MSRPRLLYLGFSFPPELYAEFSHINPAGQTFETNVIAELGKAFELRKVSAIPVELAAEKQRKYLENGWLLLLDKAPELLNWRRSLARLKRQYAVWLQEQWRPDAILCYNFSPIFNSFLRWLTPPVPKRIVLLADSMSLGRRQSFFKRLRYACKPFVYLDDQMLSFLDGCIGLSRDTERTFSAARIPWLWMPGACAPQRAVMSMAQLASGPVQFAYFGSLAPHTGLPELIDAFAKSGVKGTLHICGHGKQAEAIARRCAGQPGLQFHGLLPSPDDCIQLGAKCDVLVNPRPAIAGSENNFPSKVFEYALSGRAILTTGFSGVSAVLGPDAYYLDSANLKDSLVQSLKELSAAPRDELRARGQRVQQRIVTNYSWEEQGRKMADFISRLCVG